MKKIIICMAFIFFAIPVYADPASVLGGKPMSAPTAQYVGIGYPSLAYEWWHQGNPDWAIGGELVYGDWSGAFSDVDIGAALNIPLRWHLQHSGRADVGFLFTPGAMIGDKEIAGNGTFVAGVRGEMGVPVTVSVNNRINIITGVTVPFTVMFIRHDDPYVVIPIMPRIGVEFEATPTITPFMLVELGPTIAAGNGHSDVELGVRAWVGSVFW